MTDSDDISEMLAGQPPDEQRRIVCQGCFRLVETFLELNPQAPDDLRQAIPQSVMDLLAYSTAEALRVTESSSVSVGRDEACMTLVLSSRCTTMALRQARPDYEHIATTTLAAAAACASFKLVSQGQVGAFINDVLDVLHKHIRANRASMN